MGYKLASSTWDFKEIEAIHAVIESDMYSMGEKVETYEADFAKYIGSDFAIMTSSGSTANLLMIYKEMIPELQKTLKLPKNFLQLP